MLAELTIEDFALFDRLSLHFGPGFNVLTGETGAGKSILIDALTAGLGDRKSVSVLRPGAERTRVEAVFDGIGDQEALGEWAEDGQILFTREITANGRSTCRLNGRLGPASLVRQVASLLLDVHGQHEHQSLLSTERHGEFLNAWAGAEVTDLLAQGERKYDALRSLREELRRLRGDDRDRAQRLDLYRFQAQEIQEAALEAGEEEVLRGELNRLANAERLMAGVASVAERLSRGEVTALELLGSAVAELEALSELDSGMAPVAETLRGALAGAEDALHTLRGYEEGLEHNPERLEQVQERLELIRQLKRKYGDTIAEIIAHGESVAAELDSLEHGEERAEELEQQVAKAEAGLDRFLPRLAKQRRQAGKRFASAVSGHLADLGMGGVRFEVEAPEPRRAADAPQASFAGLLGRVQFLLAANPGQPLQPLARVASGGETSRVMLAIKCALADANPVPTLIFDEIDAGVGGHMGMVLGEKLAQLAQRAQVLCVTHLPQIAGMADTHLRVAKITVESAGETASVIRVECLEGEARVGELARMLGGSEETARRHARELLAAGQAVSGR